MTFSPSSMSASACNYGDFVWNDRNVPKGTVWVRVDLKSQIISVFRGGHEIGTAVILYGADEKETPDGVFPGPREDQGPQVRDLRRRARCPTRCG